MAGIGIEEKAAAIVRGNRCNKNKLAGIGSRTGAHPIIISNECYENEKAPNFAIWALKGPRVRISGNQVHGWRHALQSSEADVEAIRNLVSSFEKAAFVINKPATPPLVSANRAESDNPNDVVVLIDGMASKVDRNTLSPTNGTD